MYNIKVRRTPVTADVVEKKQQLNITSVCVCVCVLVFLH
jgi:hypothetical protein